MEGTRTRPDARDDEAVADGAAGEAPVAEAETVWLRAPAERAGAPVRAYVALGSNLGDRAATLRGALARLGAVPGVRVAGASPVYEAAAHTLPGQAPQPAFLNAVAALDTTLAPLDLLRALLEVEADSGRVRAEVGRWAPRPLDLDVALYGDRVVDEPGLQVPHPRLAARRFVLAPLADLAPDAAVPGAGASVSELLARCPDAAPLARTALRLA